MNEKPERYMELENRVWNNLNSNGLLKAVIGHSAHASDISDYVGVKFYNEYQLNTSTNQYMMWIQIQIRQEEAVQPVTPKIYRLTKDENEQRRICSQIWEGISEDDLKYIAQVAAEEYHSGRIWMDDAQKDSMKGFLPAVQRKDVAIELTLELAQYIVFLKE